MELHRERVNKVAADVRHFFGKGEKFRISHGSTNSTRQANDKGNKSINICGLSNIWNVDLVRQTVLTEPNVPMDRLVEETMKYGLIPPVVMEFPGITVGGGYAGTSGESSSFKHGFFDRNINWAEMVLANGEVVTCSDKERSDLFHGAAGALGTLGVTTLVELQLKKASKFVKTTFFPVSHIAEAIDKIQQETASSDLDYADGIMFSETEGAIITGCLTDDPGTDVPVQTFSGAGDPWFYLHVRDQLRQQSEKPYTEAIPLTEYLFRYDRGGFWVGSLAFEYFRTPFNRLTRWLLDDFLHTRMMYVALHASGQSNRYVVQDLVLPYSTAEEFVRYTQEFFGIYPLWLCPLQSHPYPGMHPSSCDRDVNGKIISKPMLNIGLWGPGPANRKHFVELNRNLEHKVQQLGGMKWLYAHTYYTEEEFWQVYDRKWYNELREKYGATALYSVYDKVGVKYSGANERVSNMTLAASYVCDIWPLGGLFGVFKAITSGAYLEARASWWRTNKIMNWIAGKQRHSGIN